MTTIVIALVATLKPVDRLSKLSLMRDIVFYLAAAFWTFNLLWKSKTNLWNAIGKLIDIEVQSYMAFHAAY